MDYSKVKYKLSQYNVFHQDGDVQYIWNTYSDALVKLEKDGQEYIRSFAGIDDKNDEFNRLKTNGFIVCEQLDEFGRVCIEEKQAYFTPNPDYVDILIILGMGCNCKCSYCFQKTQAADRSGAMTPETAEKVVEYICEQLKNNRNAKKLYIMWFGGEPLLYLDVMEIISRKLIKYTQKNNIEYAAGVPSNGLLLNEKNLAILQELQVKEIQICLDGMRDLHCISKGVTPKDFDSVIDNICHIIGKTRFMIRLNIPNNDVNEAIAIADYLYKQRDLLGKVYLQFAYLCDYMLSYEESRKAYQNYIYNFSLWVDYLFEQFGLRVASPKRTLKLCYRASISRSCIAPNGELYTCLHYAGNEKKVMGNIWQGRFFNDAESMFYFTANSPQRSKCINCKYLPICGGECFKDCMTGIVRHDCNLKKSLWLKLRLLKEGMLI